MENKTYFKEFHLSPFSSRPQDTFFIFGVFLFIYMLGVVVNVSIMAVIYLYPHLHSPMYLFLCALSSVDICYTTVIIPKLLSVLLSKDNKVSLAQCFTQMFFFFMASGAEDLLLAVMAYDRYVAICIPLRYNQILNRRNCILITTGIWTAGSLNSLIFTKSASNMSFCGPNTVHQLYCDSKALSRIACAGTELFHIVMYLELLVFGLGSFLCTLASYIKIIAVILKIKPEDGMRKVFSTCSSHLTVLLLYYGTAGSVYLMPQTKQFHLLDQVFTAFYSTVTPILNPLIYSLRNKDVMMAIRRLVRVTNKI